MAPITASFAPPDWSSHPNHATTHLAEPRGPQRLRLQHLRQLLNHRRGGYRPAQAQAGRQDLSEGVQPAA